MDSKDRRSLTRRGTLAVAAAVVLGTSDVAGAASMYIDMLTSTQMPGMADAHMVAELEQGPGGGWTPGSTTVFEGAGLGDGLVTSADPLEYVHEIRPDLRIDSAYLFVWTADDAFHDGLEQVTIELDGELFGRGPAGGPWVGSLYSGRVEISLLSDAALRVVISESLGGDGVRDLIVRASALAVHHSAPIPEPASALLFAVGAVIVGSAVRRRA